MRSTAIAIGGVLLAAIFVVAALSVPIAHWPGILQLLIRGALFNGAGYTVTYFLWGKNSLLGHAIDAEVTRSMEKSRARVFMSHVVAIFGDDANRHRARLANPREVHLAGDLCRHVVCAVPGCGHWTSTLTLARRVDGVADPDAIAVVPICSFHWRQERTIVEHRLFYERRGERWEVARCIPWSVLP